MNRPKLVVIIGTRIANEAVLIAGEWKRPACTESRELEIDAGQALTWARVAAGKAMRAAAWLSGSASPGVDRFMQYEL